MDGVHIPQVAQVGAHPVGEVVDHGRELLLGQPDGTGLDVDHPEARLDVHHLRAGVVPPTREDIGLDARLGQGGHQLPHVDVHAAAVALTGLGER